MAGIILIVSDRPDSYEEIQQAVTEREFRCEIVPHDIAAMEWLRAANPAELVGIIVDQQLPDGLYGDDRGAHPEFGVMREYILDETWIPFMTELTQIAKWYRPVARIVVLVCANPNYPGGDLQWMLDTHPLQWLENVARPLPMEFHDPIGSRPEWSWSAVLSHWGAMLLDEFRVLSDWEVEQLRAQQKSE